VITTMLRTKVARFLVVIIPFLAFTNLGLPAIALLWGEPFWKGVAFAAGFWYLMLMLVLGVAALFAFAWGLLSIGEWIGRGE